MKKSFPVIALSLLLVYLSGFADEAGHKTLQLLASHTKMLSGAMAHWVAAHLPQTTTGKTTLHILLAVLIPLIVISFSYKVIKEVMYVDRMYVRRDLLEAGKLKPTDLTPEEYNFIYIHWPDLFKP